MSALDQTVFVIANGKIVESKIRDLSGYIDETTTPYGIDTRFHVRGDELWTWGHAGNNPRMVSKYESEEDALAALDETFYQDFLCCSDISWFPTQKEAEQFLAEITISDMTAADIYDYMCAYSGEPVSVNPEQYAKILQLHVRRVGEEQFMKNFNELFVD